MKCPQCGSLGSKKVKCVDSRNSHYGGQYSKYRRYKCKVCGHKFSTTELYGNNRSAIIVGSKLSSVHEAAIKKIRELVDSLKGSDPCQ